MLGSYLASRRRQRKGRSAFFFVRRPRRLRPVRRLPPAQVRTQLLGEPRFAIRNGFRRLLAGHDPGVRRLVHRVKGDCRDFALGPARGVGYSARLAFRRRSSVVERILGKAEVGSSILPGGTTTSSVGAPGLNRPQRCPDRGCRRFRRYSSFCAPWPIPPVLSRDAHLHRARSRGAR